MADRREQLNISPGKFDPEVYQYLVGLSKSRRLSDMVHRWAAAELAAAQDPSTSGCSCTAVLEEIKQMKQILLQQSVSLVMQQPEISAPSTMAQITGNKVVTLLPAEETDYNF